MARMAESEELSEDTMEAESAVPLQRTATVSFSFGGTAGVLSGLLLSFLLFTLHTTHRVSIFNFFPGVTDVFAPWLLAGNSSTLTTNLSALATPSPPCRVPTVSAVAEALSTRFASGFVVHIGKTGGMSIKNNVKSQLVEAGCLQVIGVHLQRFKETYNASSLYAITIRNPIRRFVSAFYFGWVSPVKADASRILKDQRYAKRASFYKEYSTVSLFAEALYNSSGHLQTSVVDRFDVNRHITCGIDFYLDGFLLTVPVGAPSIYRNIVVVTTENLAADAAAGLGISVRGHANRQDHDDIDKRLSPLALSNVVLFLARDFAIIERLNAIKVLTPLQYEVLSNKSYLISG
jgi:hypothetical protein